MRVVSLEAFRFGGRHCCVSHQLAVAETERPGRSQGQGRERSHPLVLVGLTQLWPGQNSHLVAQATHQALLARLHPRLP